MAPVHLELTGFKESMEQLVAAMMDAAGTAAGIRFHQKENVYKALRVLHGLTTTKTNFGFCFKVLK